MMKNPILKIIYLIVIVMTINSQIVKNWYKIFIHINSTMHLLFYLNLIFYFCLWHSMNDCIDFYNFLTLTNKYMLIQL